MRFRHAVLLAAAVATATCGAGEGPTLHDLGSVEELRAAFQADAGQPRLVLLLSPT